jgi:hypothetical protein
MALPPRTWKPRKGKVVTRTVALKKRKKEKRKQTKRTVAFLLRPKGAEN